MVPVEVGCLAVLAVFAYAWRSRIRDRAFLQELAAVTFAAWLTEDTCIRFYGFYEYHAPWSVFVDRVPLLVALIWPVVILSARDLALAISRRTPSDDARLLEVRAIGRTGLIVLADAALIEPIAAHAGLWRWTAEGPFGVPLIGIAGWSIFAWAVALSLTTKRVAFVISAPVLLTHALLLALWWGALRWIPAPPDAGAAISIAVIGVFATFLIWRRPSQPVPGDVLVARFAAACFFGALLASGPAPDPWLLLWAGALVPPWLAFVWRNRTRSR
jgi:hypothetical protein